jgi:hypothetical protein|uniref:Uncharacterized protein n=1 Tax=Siphoviridae sp. ctVOP12 TaxID=2825531 RepID=A0A8S5VA00_9CAUD|nr:MAG TPA: hypothetical protein [Siphoviridae sp. ctVOP12]
MGKNTPGKQKTVRLSQEELKDLCQKAVEDGVAKYINIQNQKKKQEWRGLLFRTKKLLENYTKLKDYAEQAVVTLEQAEEVDETLVNLDVLMKFKLFEDDKTLHRQLRGVNAVKFMMAHVDRMLEVYKSNCLNSSQETMHRRWFVIEYMYLESEDTKKTTKEIAEIYQTDISNIQKDAKEARNDLTTLFFGLDAMVLYEIRD